MYEFINHIAITPMRTGYQVDISYLIPDVTRRAASQHAFTTVDEVNAFIKELETSPLQYKPADDEPIPAPPV